MPMYRTEAVTYLKELLNICNGMSPEAVSFERFKNSDSISYRVQIKGTIHESDKQMVRDIAKKHSLAVKEEQGEVVVYKP
jgi:hypothetical protein